MSEIKVGDFVTLPGDRNKFEVYATREKWLWLVGDDSESGIIRRSSSATKVPNFFVPGKTYRLLINPGVTYRCHDTYLHGDQKMAVLFWERKRDNSRGILGAYDAEFKSGNYREIA